MRHGTIIMKLQRWTWDNWVIYSIQVIMAVSIIYGMVAMITSIEETPEMARRRKEVEAVVEEREKREEEEAKHTCVDIDYEEHPELNPELSAPSIPKYKRTIKIFDTVALAH